MKLHEFLHARKFSVTIMLGLLVQAEHIHVSADYLARFSAQTNHFEPRIADHGSDMVDSDVRWRANKNLS